MKLGSQMFLVLAFLTSQAWAKEVVVYTSVDDVFARPICERFEKQTGIKVKLVPDTEETKSTGLLNRLIAEKTRPQADVFWSGDPVRAAILKSKGVSVAYHPASAEGLPKTFSDSDGFWVGFSARARIILFNKTLVSKGSEPTSVLDLADPKFKGQGCIANPLFGTTSMHAAALFESLGEKRAKDLFNKMTDNGVKMVSSNGEIRRQVADGGCAIGIADTDDAYEAIKDGKPIGVVYPDQKGMGTVIVPNATVLIAKGPNPNEARKFINFLLSAEIEKTLADGDAAQIPLRSGVRVPAHVRSLSDLNPMKVNYAKLADELDSLSHGFLKEWTEKNTK